tara:strand:+ start:282 stop:503 length:222 start_codon:yes stop_codon:yes gene_type:complete
MMAIIKYIPSLLVALFRLTLLALLTMFSITLLSLVVAVDRVLAVEWAAAVVQVAIVPRGTLKQVAVEAQVKLG